MNKFTRQHPPLFGAVDSDGVIRPLFIRSKEPAPRDVAKQREQSEEYGDGYSAREHECERYIRSGRIVVHLPQPFDAEFAAKCWLAAIVFCLGAWGFMIWFVISMLF